MFCSQSPSLAKIFYMWDQDGESSWPEVFFMCDVSQLNSQLIFSPNLRPISVRPRSIQDRLTVNQNNPPPWFPPPPTSSLLLPPSATRNRRPSYSRSPTTSSTIPPLGAASPPSPTPPQAPIPHTTVDATRRGPPDPTSSCSVIQRIEATPFE